MKRFCLAAAFVLLPFLALAQSPQPTPCPSCNTLLKTTQDDASDQTAAVAASFGDRPALGPYRKVTLALRAYHQDLADGLQAGAKDRLVTRLQNSAINPQKVCNMIMIYDMMIPIINSMTGQNLPIVPLPPFCLTPTPTKAANAAGNVPHLAPPAEAPLPVSPVKHGRGLKLPPPEKLSAMHLADAQRKAAEHKALALRAIAPLPTSYDARKYATPIKDQGQCGSCWDFSGVAMVETANILAGKLTPSTTAQLSEQYVLDGCAGSNGGCNGDDNTTVLGDAKSGGLPLTTAYGPYQEYSAGCHTMSGNGTLMYTASNWGFVSTSQGIASTNMIKAAIMQYKCVGCAVAAGNDWNNYSGGVFTGNDTDVDHDVDLYGWKDDATIPGGGYWIMRNHWGTNWGDNGWMYIPYQRCQIGTEAVYCVAGNPVPYNPGPNPPPTPDTPTHRASVLMEKGARLNKTNPTLVDKAIRAAEDVLQNAP